MTKDCSTCKWWLGGTYDCCRLNLEKECREGEYEAYAPKDDQGGTCGNDFCEI